MNYRLVTTLALLTLIAPSYESCGLGEYESAGICYTCPRGFYCSGDVMIRCPLGTYSDYKSGSCTPCKPGFKCPTSNSQSIACQLGEYSLGGSVSCNACPPGYYCEDTTKLNACNPGEYCLGGRNPKRQCPVGHMCPFPYSDPIPCLDGSYAEIQGKSACTTCPPGSYCPTKTSAGTTCPTGYYSLGGATKCTLCPAGSYCTTTTVTPCSANTFSTPGSSACAPCPDGYVCTSGVVQSCASGKFPRNNVCVDCTIQNHCSGGIVYDCPDGYYFSASGVCTMCAAGNACPKDSLRQTPCPTGTYSEPGSSTCTVCPVGNYCPSPSTPTKIPCPTGTYQNLVGQTSCINCGAASDCKSSGKSTPPTACTSGQYFNNLDDCKDCVAGYYCPFVDKPIMLPCKEGFYSQAKWTECKICPAGFACKGGSNKDECPVGYYSSEGSTRCLPCPAGYRCDSALRTPAGIAKCPPGYIGSVKGDLKDSCVICPAGFMCPFSEFPPILCPKGTHAYRSGMTACIPCPHGYSCGVGGSGIIKSCPSGTYSYLYEDTCTDCPVLSACTGNEKVDCPLNYYTPGKKADFCTPCDEGFHCLLNRNTPVPVLSYSPTACAADEYSLSTTFGCLKCPIGYFCNNGKGKECGVNTYSYEERATACKTCPDEMYSPGGASVCQVCPGGHNCNSGVPIPCPPGKYSFPGERNCQTGKAGFIYHQYSDSPNAAIYLAPKGMYSKVNGDRIAVYKCPAGKYSTRMGALDLTDCLDCPKGFYCLEGTGNPLLYMCPQGHYCPLGTTYPVPCPVDTYSTVRGGGEPEACRPCPIGYTCAGAGGMPKPCPMGYYCPGNDKKKCPAGYYTGSRTGLKSMGECLLCPAGFYCPEGTENAIPVPEGFYNPWMGVSDVTSLQDCPPSYSCSQSGYATYEKVQCKLGYYCPAGTTKPDEFPCPAGTFSNSYEAISESDCILCPRGYACPEAATIDEFISILCDAGYYCPRGTPAVVDKTQTPPVKTTPKYPCPAGTFRKDKGARRIEDCIPCPHGEYCEEGTVTPIDCVQGYYCPLGTESVNQYPCKPGTYSDNTKLLSQEGCKKCGLGNFCTGGKTVPENCPIGTYNDFSEQASECAPCPAGSFCGAAGTSKPTLCLAGTYSSAGASLCTPCKAGYFCPEDGISENVMLTIFKCYAGMMCGSPGQDAYPTLTTKGCPAGQYCLEADISVYKCPKGTYNPFTGRASLDECLITPAGHYTDQEGSTAYAPCLEGHFCLSGSSSSKQYKCPAGTFRNMKGGTSPEDCGTCWAGYQCPTAGLATPSSCLAGYYCPTGTIIPEACPEGTYSTATDLYDSQACTSCPPGYYCPHRGLTAATEMCDAGFYCIGGSKRPEPRDMITGDLCPMIGYCPKGVTTPTACLAGKYVVIKGAADISKCIDCLAGSYCDGTPNIQPKGLCDPGYFCPKGTGSRTPTTKAGPGYYAPMGSISQLKCPFGKFSKLGGKALCDDCDSGSLCNKVGITDKLPCPKGYYCPAYSWFVKSLLTYDKQSCPPGTYNEDENRASITDCKPCPAGYFCPTRAVISIPTDGTRDCAPQYYCVSKSPYKRPPFDDYPNTPFGICPTGKYCPQKTGEPKGCDVGTYSTSKMLMNPSECLNCYEGKYCEVAGISAPSGDCDLGYYCEVKETSSSPAGKICTNPLYCPLGSGVPINCPTGFYQTTNGRGVCDECSKGKYCYAGTEHTCKAGYYCP